MCESTALCRLEQTPTIALLRCRSSCGWYPSVLTNRMSLTHAAISACVSKLASSGAPSRAVPGSRGCQAAAELTVLEQAVRTVRAAHRAHCIITRVTSDTASPERLTARGPVRPQTPRGALDRV